MPLPNTIRDIWRLCYDHKSTSIVMLNDLDESDEVTVPHFVRGRNFNDILYTVF